MSEAVMISIRPKWCELIASGRKTVEIRKTRPKLQPPFRCYIYMTAGNASIQTPKGTHHHSGGKCVIGEFTCKETVPIKMLSNSAIHDWYCHKLYDACISFEEMAAYIGAGKTGYGWKISDLVIYDKPKELSEFRVESTSTTGWQMLEKMKRPPQSWCYVE